jgi:hypothetical protein
MGAYKKFEDINKIASIKIDKTRDVFLLFLTKQLIKNKLMIMDIHAAREALQIKQRDNRNKFTKQKDLIHLFLAKIKIKKFKGVK